MIASPSSIKVGCSHLEPSLALLGGFGGGYRVSAEVEGPPPALEVGEATWVDGRLDCEVAQPAALLEALLRAGPSLVSLSVRKPSLETVFFNLTGRSLRD